MLFNSFDYVVFLILVFGIYWLLEPSASPLARRVAGRDAARLGWLRTTRTALLLLASYLFYMSWNSVFILLIIGSTLVDYWVGLALGRTENERARKGLVALSLVVNLGLLGLFKYADFGLAATAQVAGLFGVAWEPPLLHLILPVGISFYTFQTLSYTIDVYRGRLPPHRNVLEFATYVAFFPQLVAGPIVRAKEFLWQFGEKPTLTAKGAQSGIYLILRGLVKKVAIADFLATRLIDRVFDNPGAFSSAEVIVAVYAYTWQLYGDFSGYTDIARGSARLLGFELPENFDRPFNSTGPIEFWRQWHITLSRWVQDYIYIPLGGSQKGAGRTYANLFLSFFIIGVWHGAGWTFVIFGLWHATGVTLNRLWRRYREKRGLSNRPPKGGWKRAVLVFISVHFFVVHWPIFRGKNLGNMLDVYEQMLAGDWVPLRIGGWVWAVIVGMAVVHFAPRAWVDGVERRLRELPWPLMGLLVVLVGALLMHVSAGQAAPFIYFQF
jgi:D-alanyl-lipoteichoic acid acyltransferase DltB (MBOAT superfamily)